MNSYELMLIFDSALGEEKIDAILSKIESKIKGLKGEVEKTDKWGNRRLASMMRKAKKVAQAYYVVIYFKGESSLPGALQNYLKVTENIIRYSVIRGGERPPAEVESVPLEKTAGIEAVNVGEIKDVGPGEGESGGQS